MIEVKYYETIIEFQSLSNQVYAETPSKSGGFWDRAAIYASKAGHDKPFASEMAYMIVTLHRTGA